MNDSDYLPLLTPDALIVYPSRAKLVILALGAVALAAGGVLAWNHGDIEYQIVAIAAWLFFGLGFFFIVWKLIKRTPSLIVNQSGIFDNSSALGSYFLRWDEIDSISISTMTIRSSRQRFLAVTLKDTEGFLSRRGALVGTLLRGNIKLVGAPLAISAVSLPISLEELLAVIKSKSTGVRVS